MEERSVVFISHANPEDNDFVSWLGSRLANAGYNVWADILSLVGGEMISPVIGDVIRKDAAIVIVALSRASYRKEGVLNEIAIATTVERKLGKPGFILPVVLDDLPRSDFPDDLVRRLSIDFSRDWADGLIDVETALEDAQTPRSENGRDAAMAAWRAFRVRGSALPTNGPDTLCFKLESLPRRIRFARFLPSSDIDGAFKHFHTPAHRFHRLAISFADAQTLMAEAPGVGLEDAYEVDLGAFLAGHRIEGVAQIFSRDARNILIGLLNKAWERSVQDRGLLRREFVSGDSWFVPLGLFEKDRATYTDDDGKTHWRQLAGRSETRDIHWHFGVSARATVAEPCYITLRSHVVFTEDGQTPLEGDRTHRLRRSFCKNWWNARWRDMLRGFVANIAEQADRVELRLSPDATVSMYTTPMRFGASVWVDEDRTLTPNQEVELEDYDYDGFDEADETEG